MSKEWERNLTSIVRETESNLARVRERLDGSEYRSFASGLSTQPMSNGALKYSTPTKPLPSSTYNAYQPASDYGGALGHTGYRSAWQDDYKGSADSIVSDHTPALVAMLSEKIETQNKIMEDLVRQVKSLERDREQTTTRLRNMEREMMAVGRRLEESGVHLETERKMDRTQQELRMKMSELENQVLLQKQSGVTESAYGDDVLSSMTRELHDFKRQTHEECDALHREIESLRTRMVKAEVEVSGQQADGQEMTRRIDRLDRTVTSISDSQRIQTKDISQSMRQKHTTDRELDQLRNNMGRLMHTVDRLEHDTSVTQPTSNLMSAGQAAALVKTTKSNTDFKASSKRKPYRRDRGRVKLKHSAPEAAGIVTLDSSSEDDTNQLDISDTLSLSSSSDDDLALGPYNGKQLPFGANTGIPGEDVNELLSDLDNNLEGTNNEPLDVADLSDTPTISSVELDSDLY